jgi:RND family efflux transporter MFP subunit
VRTAKIESRAQESFQEVVGTVRAKTRATLEAKVSGRIVELPVVLGQAVAAGELIARLDAPEVKARLESAEAALVFADQDWKRVSKLFEQQTSARAEAEAADSRLRMAKAAVQEAKAMVGYTEVLAPFSGRIARRHAERGDLAVPGKPLVDLEDPNDLQLDADIPESFIGTLKQGLSIAIQAEGSANRAAGIVTEISPAADPATRTLHVRLDLPSNSGLRPGQFARLLLPVGAVEGIWIPEAALVRRGQLEMVFTVEDGRATMRLVRAGRLQGGHIEMISGLSAGPTIVIQGAAQLRDGQPVVAE